MNTTVTWTPPAALSRSGRIIKTVSGAGWAFMPRSLPPQIESAEVDVLVQEAKCALLQYTQAMSGTPREEVCERFFPTTAGEDGIEIIRQNREPWRNRTKEHELYIQAARPEGPFMALLTPTRLAAIHRDLVDDGEAVTQRFFRPGVLRQGSAVLTRADGQIELVHPPSEWIETLLGQLASYIEASERESTHPLIVAAVLHYQLVAIHPFTDGNGRLARFLTELWFLQTQTVAPALPLTPIFRRHYAGYLARLAGVTINEEWSKWIRFFCAAIIRETTEAVNRTPTLITAAH